ncbi:PAS domain S-box protein [Sporolactobacillus sp. THM7-4]|nr:PAS domain S-box protein [Sporolactobacillus sp. THM7-4]
MCKWRGGKNRMFADISLSSLALSCDGMPGMDKMKAVPADGTLRHLEHFSGHKDLVLVDKNGTPTGWIPFQKLADVLLSEWKKISAYYETLLECIDDAVTVVNGEGHIAGWNPGAEKLYQYEERKAEDRPITYFFKEDSLVLMSVLKDGTKVKRKYNQPAEDVHVLINARPIILGGRIIGGISLERNISDIVKLNEELSSTTAYIQHLESKLENGKEAGPFHKIKGRSPALRSAIKLSEKVAGTDASVLITGESGVGKELFAQAIHQAGSRSSYPFVAVNCGAIPAALFESELFGYERGAFTGALRGGKKGRIDAAKGGTLFLDEIGEMPLELQVKLLRVLQDKQFYRVGGNEPIPIDTRIIAATNRSLEAMIAAGRFRADLYYRLNVVAIKIPPLRERIEDIPELTQICMKSFAVKYRKPVPRLDPEVMVRFMQNPWPGNIRELRNTVERLIILAEGDVITKDLLPDGLFEGSESRQTKREADIRPASIQEATEKEKIRRALQITFGNKSAAARMLGISRVTFYNRMRKYFPDEGKHFSGEK